jgi:hypothetical protein
MVLGLGFVAGFAFPYFAGGGQIDLYAGREAWLFMPIGGGMVALLVGPGQLWLGHKNRRLEVHRRLGFVYMGSIAVSVAGAFYLATHTTLGWVAASWFCWAAPLLVTEAILQGRKIFAVSRYV